MHWHCNIFLFYLMCISSIGSHFLNLLVIFELILAFGIPIGNALRSYLRTSNEKMEQWKQACHGHCCQLRVKILTKDKDTMDPPPLLSTCQRGFYLDQLLEMVNDYFLIVELVQSEIANLPHSSCNWHVQCMAAFNDKLYIFGKKRYYIFLNFPISGRLLSYLNQG